MDDKLIGFLIVGILLVIMFFFNRKVRLFALVKEQLLVLKNDKKKKISFWDILCFFVFPMVVAIILVCKLNFIIDDNLANLLTTVFSVVFTVLFGFAAIMISKIDSQNNIEKQVAEETFVSIVSSTILALVSAILSIVLTQVDSDVCLKIISASILFLSLIIIMFTLMITKRTFFLYVKHKK